MSNNTGRIVFRKKNLLIIRLSIILWIVIFDAPIISSINIVHVIGFFSWVYIFAQRNNNHKAYGLFKNCMFIVFLLYIYSVMITLIYDGEGVFTMYQVYWMLDIIPFSYAVSICLRRHNVTYFGFENSIILSGMISSALSILALISPSVQAFFIDLFIKSGYIREYFNIFGFRTYGFAYNLQYSSSIVLALMGLLSVNIAIRDNKLSYLVYACIMVFSGFINARTTLVVFAAGLLAVVFLNKKSMKRALKYTTAAVAATVICLSILEWLPYSNQTQWLLDGYYDILSLFSNKFAARYSVRQYYANNAVFLPTNLLYLLFGSGSYVVGNNRFSLQSDIGFVNDIWYNGIFYSCALYMLFYALCRKAKKALNMNQPSQGSVLFGVIFITIILSNIKGIAFSFNSISSAIWIICFISDSCEMSGVGAT